ncbi:MAG: hypothetical protein COV34_01800 [Candidatus Zambryskibacteria bacterium CG10_big_fil_rev_8_21_14_0_10_42_12]|uniref:Uncharacterized protein n=1 Tax=Candidatus Zambryskibacteria bacterium CG10_big_fil_rev_8_21_14_0_10_42_12 TaxID=1975115 RepID=A0A2H0QVL0_9BACT|nr:MAG: hypothetical protein COV34_01800 [Candidatus Zambryskibacteria bacterium CG10_big_fil_rev_8_21_14_0_10_42_12]
MKIKRAFLASMYTYLASLAVAIIGAFIFNAGTADPNEIHPVLWIVGVLGPIVFAWIFSTWYFRGSHVAQGRGQGLLLGILMIITGFVLDVITVLPTAGGFDNAITLLVSYYTQWAFWVTAVLVIFMCVLVGGNVRQAASSSSS